MSSSLEDRLATIEQRNARVQADKAWETSLTRRASIAFITYIVISLTLMVIGHDGAWIHSIVPVIGYLLSTLALRFMRKFWQKKFLPVIVAFFILAPLAAHAEIVITVAAPMTGGMAAQGEEIKSGADQAVLDINGAGGILGDTFAVHYEDDACNATQATSVANKITAHPPVGVIGDLCSAATLAAAPIYAEAGLPQITFSSNTKITESGYQNLFRIVGRDDRQAPDLVRFIAGHTPKDAKIAVLDDKGSWGLAFADMVADNLKTGGFAISRDVITSGQKDFLALISKLKTENISVVVMGLYVSEAALLVRQAREQGFTGQFYGGDPIQTPEFVKIAGKAAEGVRQSGLFDPEASPEGSKLLGILHTNNKPIGIYTYYAYAAMQAYAEAMKLASSRDNDKVIAALHANKIKTLIGPLGFDAKGDQNDFRYHIYEWKSGDVAEILK